MFFKFNSRAIFSAVVFAAFASMASAEDVTLKSVDGAYSLTGELLSFDGENYRINTVFGEFDVSIQEVSCEGGGCPDLAPTVEVFGISGASLIADVLMPSFIDAYSTDAGYDILVSDQGVNGAKIVDLFDSDNAVVATITLAGSSTAGGLDALAKGRAVLAMATRDATQLELTRIRGAGLGDLSQPDRKMVVATDGLVVLVSDDNPVQSLSIQQITDIFTGKITNWSAVGGANATIKVFRQVENSDDTGHFRSMFLENTGRDFTLSAKIIGAGIAGVVARNRNGIGFASFANGGKASAVAISGSCGITTAATPFTIKSGEYPLTTQLVVYTPDTELPQAAQGLMDFIASDKAHAIVEQAGFINQQFGFEATDTQRARFVNAIISAENASFADLQIMAMELRNATRLSATFRFDSGTNTLDARGQEDISRLVEYLGSQGLGTTEILLVGFTGAEGEAGSNAVNSLKNAQQVQQLLSQAASGALDNVQITTMGFGEVAPLVCTDMPHGGDINHRVEVWIRNMQ